jgi:hypothetical protein
MKRKSAPVIGSQETEPKYDVAISFLARDERIAAQLSDLLEEGLNVFFFPRKQEELAGTDGLESMREPFLTARIAVVLFREPWGQTPWTGVEQEAIKDRCLQERFQGLLFVQLDKESKLPDWLPTTHVRFALEQYGIDQLAGAVKMRVQERGGKIAPPSALSHARRIHREASLLADQKSLFGDRRWIEANIHEQVAWLMRRLAELTEEIKTELNMALVARALKQRCVLRDNRVSMNVGWRQGIFNTVEEEAEVIAAEFNGPLYVPDERMMTVLPPKELGRHRFTPILSLSREVRWKEVGKKVEPLPTEDLAHRIMALFLDLLSRANRGQIDLLHL